MAAHHHQRKQPPPCSSGTSVTTFYSLSGSSSSSGSSPLYRSDSPSGIRVRCKQREGRPCAVEGCGKPIHDLGRYCSKHHTNMLRHGEAEQTPVLRKHVAATEGIARALIFANRKHPAVKLVVQKINELLDLAACVAPRDKPDPYNWQARAWRELARLKSRGVTGYEVLRVVAGLHFYARANPDRLAPYSRSHRFAVARHVLSFAERERFGGWCEWNRSVQASGRTFKAVSGWNARKGTVKLSSRVLDHVGRHLLVLTIATLRRMEDAYDRQLMQQPRNAREARPSHPQSHPLNNAAEHPIA